MVHPAALLLSPCSAADEALRELSKTASRARVEVPIAVGGVDRAWQTRLKRQVEDAGKPGPHLTGQFCASPALEGEVEDDAQDGQREEDETGHT